MRRVLLAAICLVALSARALQSSCELQIQWENDTFAQGNNKTDQWYTNGTRFTRTCSSEQDAFDRAARSRLLGDWAVQGNGLDVQPYGWFFGQHMYTPREIRIAEAQPDDRPWAGWLYLGRMYQGAIAADRFGAHRPVHRLAELSIGVIGPSARARQSQTEVHRWIDSPKPAGWKNQLRDEPTVNLRWKETIKVGGPSVDTLVHWGFNVGNVQNYGNVGAAVRVGRNLGDFGVSLIGPTRTEPLARHSTLGVARGARDWTAYVTAGVDARVVVHNTFLDGNNFKDSPSVDRKPFVVDGYVGVTWSRHCSISYLLAWRSPEFRGQKGESQKFGSVIFSFPFF